MDEKENILSDAEVKDLQKQMADREAKTADKVNKLLLKGRDLTASDIKWLLGKEVRRKRISKAMRMSISTFERYLAEHGLITKKRTQPVNKVEIKLPDFKWLINQARDAEELAVKGFNLEEENSCQKKHYINDQEIIGHQEAEIQDLKKENQRYKEALKKIKTFAMNSNKGANLELIGQMERVFIWADNALEGESE